MNISKISIISKIALYFSLILFVSTYFEIGECDENFKILIHNMPISIFCALIIVLGIEKSMKKFS